MKTTIFDGIGNMLLIAIMAMLIVLFAMIVDLISGLRKAKIRGEYRSSEALKRTFTKFIKEFQIFIFIFSKIDNINYIPNGQST